jgi:hypothetical protein
MLTPVITRCTASVTLATAVILGAWVVMDRGTTEERWGFEGDSPKSVLQRLKDAPVSERRYCVVTRWDDVEPEDLQLYDDVAWNNAIQLLEDYARVLPPPNEMGAVRWSYRVTFDLNPAPTTVYVYTAIDSQTAIPGADMWIAGLEELRARPIADGARDDG